MKKGRQQRGFWTRSLGGLAGCLLEIPRLFLTHAEMYVIVFRRRVPVHKDCFCLQSILSPSITSGYTSKAEAATSKRPDVCFSTAALSDQHQRSRQAKF